MKGEVIVQSLKMDPEHSSAVVSRIFRGECGDFVAVRPCGDQYEEKTYLGVFLGNIARGFSTKYDSEAKELKVGFSGFNPAMFVPDLNEIIWGCGSWWSIIDTPDDLKQITDSDIDNVWYVKALKAMDHADQEDSV